MNIQISTNQLFETESQKKEFNEAKKAAIQIGIGFLSSITFIIAFMSIVLA